MKHIAYLFFIFSISLFSQDTIEANIKKSFSLNADRFIGINSFGEVFTIKDNRFIVIGSKLPIGNNSYTNVQLGEITSVNIFNPLKINIFYQDFNTVIILDNRLAEITRLDFNSNQPYKNITYVSTGYDNTLWLFNLDNQQLELFDFKSKTTRAKSLPIQSEVLDLKSNYNYCWLLTKNYLYKYNYFGSLITKIDNDGYTNIVENDGNIFLKKDNTIFQLKKNSKNIVPLEIQNLLINQFFVTNETLYIYDSKMLFEYQIKID